MANPITRVENDNPLHMAIALPPVVISGSGILEPYDESDELDELDTFDKLRDTDSSLSK